MPLSRASSRRDRRATTPRTPSRLSRREPRRAGRLPGTSRPPQASAGWGASAAARHEMAVGEPSTRPLSCRLGRQTPLPAGGASEGAATADRVPRRRRGRRRRRRAPRSHRDLATRPGTPRFDGVPRPVVFGVPLLEAREHALGAVGGPEHQRPVVPLVEPRSSSSSFRFDRLLWGAGRSTPPG